MAAQNFELSEHDREFVRQAVASGDYASENEVVSMALRKLEADQLELPVPLAVARALVKEGFDELDRGEYIEVPIEELAQFFDRIEHEIDTEHNARS